MDYDDSDFQSQNFQLGEDNKFPSGLRSYSLPKFDLDEHLHLRFDSIVESDVLLGIQNQEDNHWIEDFSRGSSGIEFSSSAAESCSISMRNNVWSEATSSESVEMLLKHVGDDEMITKQAVNEESHACEKLESSDHRMDVSLNHEKSLPSNIGGSIVADCTPPPEEGPKSTLASTNDAAGDLSNALDIPQILPEESSGFENLEDLDPKSSCEKYGSYVNISSQDCDLEQNIASPLIQKDSQDKSHAARCGMTEDIPDCSDVKCLEVDPSSTSIKDSNVMLNHENAQQEGTDRCSEAISCEKPECLLNDDCQAQEMEAFSKIMLMADQHSQELPIDQCRGELGNVSSLVTTTEISAQRSGLDEGALFEKPVELLKSDVGAQADVVGTEEDKNVSGVCMGNTLDSSSMEMEGKQTIESELAEGRKSIVPNLSNSVSEVNSTSNSVVNGQDTVQVEEHGIIVVNSEGSVFAAVEEKIVDNLSQADDTNHNFPLHKPSHVISENVHLLDDSPSADCSLHVSSSLHARLSQSADSGRLQDGPGDATNDRSNVSIVDKESEKLTVRISHVSSEIADLPILVKRIEASPNKEVSTGSVLGGVTELASSSILGEQNQVGDVVEHSGTTPVVSVLDFATLDRKESFVAGNSSENHAVDGGGCNSIIPVTASDTQRHLNSNSSAECPPETGASSAVGDKFVLSPCKNESQTLLTDVGCKQVSLLHSDAHVSVAKELDRHEALGIQSKDSEVANIAGDTSNCHEETSSEPHILSKNISECHPVEAGCSSPISDEPNCGSPIVISCRKPSHSERESQEVGDSIAPYKNVSLCSDYARLQSDNLSNTNDAKSIAHDSSKDNVSEDDRSFTFEVGSFANRSVKESDRGWKSFHSAPPLLSSESGDKTTTSFAEANLKVVEEASHESRRSPQRQRMHGNSKAANESKSKSSSSSATEKKTSTQEKSTKKSSHQKKSIEKKDNSPLSASVKCRSVPVEEPRQNSSIDASAIKPPGVLTMQSSNLPDLNSSALIISHQPFTDSQQVQLRAQIFVYGSLIQGTPPDEACMISAFGDTGRDDGRSLWENMWRLAVERFQNQKSPLSNPETPLHSRSAGWASEQLSRSTTVQSKPPSTTAARVGNKGGSSTIASPVMSLSSPVWNIATRDGLQSSAMPRGPFFDAHQPVSPLHPYHSSHVRHYLGSSTPWPSQTPCPVPWIVSPQTSAIDTNLQFSALPIAEAVQVTPVCDLSVPTSTKQFAPSSSLVTAGIPMSISAGTAASTEAKRTTTSSRKNALADQKSRKRKKNLTTEEFGQASPVSSCRPEPASATGVSKRLMVSPVISSLPHPEALVASGGLVPANSPITSSTHFQVIGGSSMDRRVVLSDETCSRIEQAKLHAEDAAAVAASAVKQSQGIWNQLALQKNSGLVSEVEVKLASAAVVAAAAASVAKAAAAAARAAADAAFQAKLMAGEAVSMSKRGTPTMVPDASAPDNGKNLGMVSSVSILKGSDKANNSNSVIVAARETARKRVEATSAAAKRAENMDAVVKAAELAAEAVSQAGIIVAMGDPIPLTLSELAEAGPEGYWRAQKDLSAQVRPIDMEGEHLNVDASDQGLGKLPKTPSNRKAASRTIDEGNVSLKEGVNSSVGKCAGLVNGAQSDTVPCEKGLDDALHVQSNEHERKQKVEILRACNIVEGSDVEVASDKDGFQGVWFAAKVLSLKDGKAYVCYNKLLQAEGPEKLKEWISLDGEGSKAPRIRIAHPLTASKFGGTRKRGRAAMGNYTWSVGDHVDACMRDSWWEGVVTGKSKEDETKFTVQFTAGEPSVVRPWDLRPSLMWKDGQWMEWPRGNDSSHHQGDTPEDKRRKLGLLETEGEPVDVAGRLCSDGSGRLEESRPLISEDRKFDVGKFTSEDKNPNGLRMKRTGLQKEGSRVVFGVPKPGKKRKFMEVSKHYVADHASKLSEGTGQVKFAKYLMPQGSRGYKSTPRADPKGKAAIDLKSKAVKSGKAHGFQGKRLPEKDNSSMSIVSTSSDGSGQVMHHEKHKQSQPEDTSFSNVLKTTECPVLYTSLGKPSSALGMEHGVKGKRAPSGDKSSRDEQSSSDNLGRTNPDAVEPRRSSRRIQPTSRLLEGLQSSLIISKIGPVLHERGTKSHHRTGSSRGNNHG